MSTIQYTETRRAFYAGAASLMQMMLAGVSEGEEITASDEDFMEAINNELAQWCEEVLKGRG